MQNSGIIFSVHIAAQRLALRTDTLDAVVRGGFGFREVCASLIKTMVADSFSNFLQFWSWNSRTVNWMEVFIKASLLFCLPILVLHTCLLFLRLSQYQQTLLSSDDCEHILHTTPKKVFNLLPQAQFS